MNLLIYKNINLIHIHIYKTGGISRHKSLLKYQDPVPLYYKIRNKVLTNKKFPKHLALPIHSNANDYRNFLGDEDYNKYFKFSFVSNPYSW